MAGIADSGGGGQGGTPATGSGGAGPISGCEICMKAQACCDAVGVTPPCMFDAAYCSGLDAVRQAAYVNACKTQVTTTIMAWSGNPPAACL